MAPTETECELGDRLLRARIPTARDQLSQRLAFVPLTDVLIDLGAPAANEGSRRDCPAGISSAPRKSEAHDRLRDRSLSGFAIESAASQIPEAAEGCCEFAVDTVVESGRA